MALMDSQLGALAFLGAGERPVLTLAPANAGAMAISDDLPVRWVPAGWALPAVSIWSCWQSSLAMCERCAQSWTARKSCDFACPSNCASTSWTKPAKGREGDLAREDRVFLLVLWPV